MLGSSASGSSTGLFGVPKETAAASTTTTTTTSSSSSLWERFWSKKWYGRKGQTALQVGASVSLLIVFVAIPTCRNYIKDWRKKTVDGAASRTYIHEEVTKVRMEWRRELAAKMEREAEKGVGGAVVKPASGT